MTVYTYGVSVRNKQGGTDFFVVNATTQANAKLEVMDYIEGSDDYGHEPVADIQSVTELLHEQFRGIVQLGGC